MYGVAVANLNVTEQDEMDNFEKTLRSKEKEKAEALVLAVAKIVKYFEMEVTETTKPKQNEAGPVVKQSRKDIKEGIEHAKNFLMSLLKNRSSDPEETFKMRLEFLEGKNVFSLIKPKKKLPIDKIFGGIKTAGAKVENSYEKGINNLNTNLTDLLVGAKAWRDKATKK